MEKIVINIVRRSDDYKSYLENHDEIWGCGSTPEAAIGDLVISHSGVFDIRIFWKK